jgi:CheY-like chemotaxis protein
MMPRVDGFGVLDVVRQQPSMRDLPIIVITAKELNDEDRRRLADCVQRVVLKDRLGVDELRREIRGLLDQRRARVGG